MAAGFELPEALVAEVVAWAADLAGDAAVSLVDRPTLFHHGVLYCMQRAGSMPRDLDFVEVFAGSHRATTMVLRLGMRAAAFDRDLNARHDVCLLVGLVLCGMLVLRIVPRGVVWFAPRCAAWLPWVSRSNHRRSASDPLGDTSRVDVLEANMVALVVSWLSVLAHVRHVFLGLEQPIRSHFFAHPSVEDTLRNVAAERQVTYLGGFGGESLKPLEVHATLPVHAALRLRRPHAVAAARLGVRGRPLVQPQRGGWFRGTAAMSASQTYPWEFAMSIAEMVALAKL